METHISRLRHIIGRAVNAEEIYRFALDEAEQFYGMHSAEVGLCLIDLADHLERVRKFEEAETVTARYKAILLSLSKETGSFSD